MSSHGATLPLQSHLPCLRCSSRHKACKPLPLSVLRPSAPHPSSSAHGMTHTYLLPDSMWVLRAQEPRPLPAASWEVLLGQGHGAQSACALQRYRHTAPKQLHACSLRPKVTPSKQRSRAKGGESLNFTPLSRQQTDGTGRGSSSGLNSSGDEHGARLPGILNQKPLQGGGFPRDRRGQSQVSGVCPLPSPPLMNWCPGPPRRSSG